MYFHQIQWGQFKCLINKITETYKFKFIIMQSKRQLISIKNSIQKQVKSKTYLNNQFQQKKNKIGPGLQNLGNTCFINAVLQCLTYTRPLVKYLSKKYNHKKICSKTNIDQFCFVCMVSNHVKLCQKNIQDVISPDDIVKNINKLLIKYRFGRQEDSHELLRSFIDNFQKVYQSQNNQNETIIQKIFGGKLQSQIECMKCSYKSIQYENFYDLSLNVKNFLNLNQCINEFFQIEELNEENQFKCDKCEKLAPIQKRYLINKEPNILTIHLKRFNNQNCKIGNRIQYEETLNLQIYHNQQQNCMYNLYAVLVHHGPTCRSGHYYSFIKHSDNQWYCMDDNSVYQVPVEKVLNQQAYILFYVKTEQEQNIQEIKHQIQIEVNNDSNECMQNDLFSCSHLLSPNKKYVNNPLNQFYLSNQKQSQNKENKVKNSKRKYSDILQENLHNSDLQKLEYLCQKKIKSQESTSDTSQDYETKLQTQNQ